MNQFSHQIIVSCLIRDHLDQVLLVRHHKRGWELPQGKVEAGESVLVALGREIEEEAGVQVEAPVLVAIWSCLSQPAALILTFAARYARGEARPSAETPEVKWVSMQEIFDWVSHPINRDRIKAVLDDFSGQPSFHAYTTGPYTIMPARNGD